MTPPPPKKELNVPLLIASLAAIVRIHEGNRDPKITTMLEDADEARAAVAQLCESAQSVVDLCPEGHGWGYSIPAAPVNDLRAAVARVGVCS